MFKIITKKKQYTQEEVFVNFCSENLENKGRYTKTTWSKGKISASVTYSSASAR